MKIITLQLTLVQHLLLKEHQLGQISLLQNLKTELLGKKSSLDDHFKIIA